MAERPRVGGLDPRFAPRRPSQARLAILFAAVALGAFAGALFALSSVPDPSCAAEDGMCKLQRIYLAQAVKVIGATLLAYLLAEGLLIRLPDALDAGRRRRAYELERSLRPAPEPPRPFDATVARAALAAVGRGASLPPAALRALSGPPPPTPTAAPALRTARAAFEAVSAPAALPAAALQALAAQRASAGGGPRPAAPPAPAPIAPRVSDGEPAAARVALDAVSRSARLPPAALEALLRQGPALGGGPRRTATPPPER